MLVLSRKKGQRIIIGNHIEVTVVEIRSDRVRLGVRAPVEVPIHREEVQRRIEESERGDYEPSRQQKQPRARQAKGQH